MEMNTRLQAGLEGVGGTQLVSSMLHALRFERPIIQGQTSMGSAEPLAKCTTRQGTPRFSPAPSAKARQPATHIKP
jgi:hypothetical protein